ncbi:MAG: sulfatase [Gemmatimonadales bacterium]
MDELPGSDGATGRQDPQSSIPFTSAAWLAIAAGLSGSALELGGLAACKLSGNRFLFVSHHSVWMVPVGLTLLVLSFAAVTWLAGRRLPRLRGPGTYVGIVVAVGLLSPFLVFSPRLHPAAGALLAIGIGVQAGRWAARRTAVALRLAPRAAAVLGGALLTAAVTTTVLERRARLAEPEGSPAESSLPNILLLVLDTVRAVDLSLYGYGRPTTPFLEQLGRRGVVFEQAIAASSWTLPTHATLFTGRWPNALSADWQSPLSPERTTLAEYFRARGYRTGGFVGNLTYTSREVGLAQGFETYDDRLVRPSEFLRALAIGRFVLDAPRFHVLFGARWPEARNTASELRDHFLSWVDRGPADQPFLGFVNLFDAHAPYDPDPAFLGRFGPVSRLPLTTRVRRFLSGRGPGAYRDSSGIAESKLRYDEGIATIDHEIESLVAGLAERDRLERTVIVLVSDHGELFGEGGQIGHGANLHVNTLHVPMLIVGPGVASGVRIPDLVSVRDLARTIADVAGANPDVFQGHSLRPLWEAAPDAQTSPPMAMISGVIDPNSRRRRNQGVPIRKGSMASLMRDSLQVVASTDGSTELYRLSNDLPWAREIALSAVPSDSLGRLVSTLWTLWGGRSSEVGPLITDNQTFGQAPRAGANAALATVIPSIPTRLGVRPPPECARWGPLAAPQIYARVLSCW